MEGWYRLREAFGDIRLMIGTINAEFIATNVAEEIRSLWNIVLAPSGPVRDYYDNESVMESPFWTSVAILALSRTARIFGFCPVQEFKEIDVAWSSVPPYSNRTDADYYKNDRNKIVSDHLILLGESEMGGYGREYKSIGKLEAVESNLQLPERNEIWKLVYSYRPKELWDKGKPRELKGEKWVLLTHDKTNEDFEFSSGKLALLDKSLKLHVSGQYSSDYTSA